MWDVSEALGLPIYVSEWSLMLKKKKPPSLYLVISSWLIIGRGVIMEEGSTGGKSNQLLDIKA